MICLFIWKTYIKKRESSTLFMVRKFIGLICLLLVLISMIMVMNLVFGNSQKITEDLNEQNYTATENGEEIYQFDLGKR